MENIHEKSSIPTPESISGETTEKHDKSKGSPSRLTGITKQPSPLIVTRVSSTPRSGSNSDTNITTLPEVSSIILEPKSEDERGFSPTFGLPTIQLVQSGEEKTGRELSSIMQENSKQARKRGANNEVINWTDMLAKKIRLEEALNNINARQAQVKANLIRLSGSYNSSTTTAIVSSMAESQLVMSSYTHSPTTNAQDHQPTCTPHETPHGTPAPSPLPSPCLSMPPTSLLNHQSYPSSPHPLSTQNMSQPGTPINSNSLPTSPGYSNQPTPAGHMYYPSSSPQGTVFFNSQVSIPPVYQQHSIIPTLVHVPHGYGHSPNPNSSQLSSPTVPHQPPFSPFKFPNSVHNSTGPSPSKVSCEKVRVHVLKYFNQIIKKNCGDKLIANCIICFFGDLFCIQYSY